MKMTTLRWGTLPKEAQGGLILLHGRGATADDMVGLAQALPAKNLALVAPQAAGFSWYPQRFFAPLTENEPWLSEALEKVDQEVAALRDAGIPSERIGLMGFSQGGCLALEWAHRRSCSLGFVAGLSSALIGPPGVARGTSDLRGVPVLLACAEEDPHIPVAQVLESTEVLKSAQAKLTSWVFPGGDHAVFAEEIAWVSEQIRGWR
ncbi:putative esterase [Haloferula luteola]|uniref:Putative esterase n=1 Tax=Haloferula luteola TaxID=595692 RepID=A0A840V100_9BACT|nr:dienelactone hydrolase family protein [Haloferula luteola]MBB5351672.1 putative esterase [Haloferula luteola]